MTEGVACGKAMTEGVARAKPAASAKPKRNREKKSLRTFVMATKVRRKFEISKKFPLFLFAEVTLFLYAEVSLLGFYLLQQAGFLCI